MIYPAGYFTFIPTSKHRQKVFCVPKSICLHQLMPAKALRHHSWASC